MIVPTSGDIVIPQQTADSLWITSIVINAPLPSRPIAASIRVVPMNSTNGTLYGNMAKSINIQDITGASSQYPSIMPAMSGLLQAAQDVISGSKLF